MEETQPLPQDPLARHQIAFILYLPVLGVVGYYVILAAFVLAHGAMAGLFSLPYAGIFYLLARRAFLVKRGGVPAPSVWKDIVAMLVADILLFVMFLSAAT